MIGDENFQSWKQQVLFTVRGFNLESHLFGTNAVPQFVVDVDGNNTEHPEYANFIQRDSSLAFWLLASISPYVNHCLLGCMTACLI